MYVRMYACICQCHVNILYVYKEVIHATKESDKHVLHAIKESNKWMMSAETRRDLQLERKLQRQTPNRQCETPEPLREEVRKDRAKSQSKCRNDEHVLHKDTYYIIKHDESFSKKEYNRDNKKKTNHQCGVPEQESYRFKCTERERERWPSCPHVLSLNEELVIHRESYPPLEGQRAAEMPKQPQLQKIEY